MPTNVSGTCFVTAIQASTSSYLGESSNLTALNFFWQYAPAWTTAITSYSCPLGGTVSFTGSSYICTLAQSPPGYCPPGTTPVGSNCTYTATPNYSSSWTCPLGGTITSGLCSISGRFRSQFAEPGPEGLEADPLANSHSKEGPIVKSKMTEKVERATTLQKRKAMGTEHNYGHFGGNLGG